MATAATSDSEQPTECKQCRDIRTKHAIGENIVVRLKENMQQVMKNPDSEFVKVVNALLNEKGGLIIIHTEDVRFLDLFNSKVDNRLEALIPDHSLFHERFEIHIYDGIHVIYRVKPVSRKRLCSTMDFYSRVSRNVGLTDPTHSQITELYRSLLNTENKEDDFHREDLDLRWSKRDDDQPEVMLDGWPFQENYYLQAKHTQKDFDGMPVKELANYFWNDLKLCRYISALSKVPGGGFVLFGVHEKPEKREKKKNKEEKKTKKKTEKKDETIKSYRYYGYALPPKECSLLCTLLEEMSLNNMVFYGPEPPIKPITVTRRVLEWMGPTPNSQSCIGPTPNPQLSIGPTPDSQPSSDLTPDSQPCIGPTSNPHLSIGPTPDSQPSSDPTLDSQPSSDPTLDSQPSSGPTPNSHPCFGPTSNPQQFSGPTSNPQPSSGPTPNSQPSSGPTPNSQPCIGPTSNPQQFSGPTPNSQPSSGPTPNSQPSSGSSPNTQPSSGPSPNTQPSSGPSPNPQSPPDPKPSIGLPPDPQPSTSGQSPDQDSPDKCIVQVKINYYHGLCFSHPPQAYKLLRYDDGVVGDSDTNNDTTQAQRKFQFHGLTSDPGGNVETVTDVRIVRLGKKEWLKHTLDSIF